MANSISGLSAMIGLNISTKALAVLIGGAVIGGLLGTKVLGTRPVVITARARAYATDTNQGMAYGKVLSIIAKSANNVADVTQNIHDIKDKIAAYRLNINALIDQRKTGEISRNEFNARLGEIARIIMASLGITGTTRVHQTVKRY